MKPTSHENIRQLEERAVLVSLVLKERDMREELAEYSLQELIRLAETAGVQVVETLRQSRDRVDPKWLIGKGKMEELKLLLQTLDANTAIFDQELSGIQVRNLEEALDVKIIDRTQLILDIFAGRAKTREGILQVELAQHSYLLPRLVGHGKNLSRQGGGIGTRGPGETKLETDRRHIRNRIGELKRQLEEVTRTRTLHRQRRRKTGIFQVALVGYTNAGKSTLLRQLTAADVYVENQLFATLDPTSRTLELPNGKEILVTDTVGFIQNLPHDLVAAFRATLEEANEADLILHVVDSSIDMREEQMRVVHEVLEELGAHGKEMLTVFNKIDLCPPEELELLSTAEGESIRVSAYNQEDLLRLQLMIQDKMAGGVKHFRIPAVQGDKISLAYRLGTVVETGMDGEDMVISVDVNAQDYDKYGYMLAGLEVTAGQADKGEFTAG